MHSLSQSNGDREPPISGESASASRHEPDWASGASPTDEQQNALYDTGRTLYQHQKFAEATCIFLYLVMQDMFNPRYAFALAACFQAHGALETACLVYAHCQSLEPGNPLAAFQLGECQMQLGRRDEALQNYRHALALSEKAPHLSALAHRARGMADLIEGVTRG